MARRQHLLQHSSCWRPRQHHARGGVGRTARADHSTRPGRNRHEASGARRRARAVRGRTRSGKRRRRLVQRPHRRPAAGREDAPTLLEGGTDPRYLSSGHLIYQLNGVLYARTFDPSRIAVGGAVPVVEGVFRGSGGHDAWYAVSDSGTLLYLPGPVSAGGSADQRPRPLCQSRITAGEAQRVCAFMLRYIAIPTKGVGLEQLPGGAARAGARPTRGSRPRAAGRRGWERCRPARTRSGPPRPARGRSRRRKRERPRGCGSLSPL